MYITAALERLSLASRAFRTCVTVGLGLAAVVRAGVVHGGLAASTGALGLFEGFQGKRLEFADELVQPSGVVEPCLVDPLLVFADLAGDGLAGDGTGPAQVGAVQRRWISVAPAGGGTAGAAAPDEAAGQREADLHEFAGDACFSLA